MSKSFGKRVEILGALALAIAAVCTTACNKDKPEVSTTTTTSSEIELERSPTKAAPAPARSGTDDYLSTVRREQMVLRGRIDDELRVIDRQLSARPSAKLRGELLEKRETLKADATVVDRADERGWDELKAVIAHDLEGQPEM